MNKSFLKFIADFGPLLIFFTIYHKSVNNLAVAIPPLIVSTIIAVIAIYLLEKKISNVFNCGYGKGYSVLEVINAANQINGNFIKYEYDKRRPGDAEKLIANVDKLHQHINWKPKFDNLN